MYFRKCHHPVNFAAPARVAAGGRLRFAARAVRLRIRDFGGEVFRIEADGPGWRRNLSQAGLTPDRGPRSAFRLRLAGPRLVLGRAAGPTLLASLPRRFLTVSGASWLMEFEPERGNRYFGMGEKHLGWEKIAVRTKFWNVDAWGDFHHAATRDATYDPAYVSIPYLAVQRDGMWFGLLIDCPDAPVIGLPDFAEGAHEATASHFGAASRPSFYIGAGSGRPSVWVIVGPSFAELTRKLQRLCGTTPLPPLWALGHHQCRWGYQDPKDLQALADGFRRHAIPNDGLWLDIDYMERFKVFTWDPALWKGEQGVRSSLARFAALGYRVVPILDPGVKVEKGYPVYESGLRRGIFCLTREGMPYTGFVWPGETAFPDFSMPKGRLWWSAAVARWATSGVGGAWLDMNDPSVGRAELEDMRFDRGRLAHGAFHNQYALGMAMASRAGFLAAHPDRRPFLLTRSGWTGISRQAAVWTGDNYANWSHLSGSVALSMALAISGVPFNGPDVPGFGEDASPELAAAWYKAGFLFPFLRNHCDKRANRKEPWAFGRHVLGIIRRYVRLRYAFLPYLYNLWIDQEERGEAVMRPLCYDFPVAPGQDLPGVGDQFMCGPALMHAPVTVGGIEQRAVVLPPGGWFHLQDGAWLAGGATHAVRQGAQGTPLFVRSGSLVPMQPMPRLDQRSDLARIELHIFLEPGGAGSCTYRWDDGESYAYRRGVRSAVVITARLDGGLLVVAADVLSAAAGPLRLALVLHGACSRAVLRTAAGERRLRLRPGRRDFCGSGLPVRVSDVVELG